MVERSIPFLLHCHTDLFAHKTDNPKSTNSIFVEVFCPKTGRNCSVIQPSVLYTYNPNVVSFFSFEICGDILKLLCLPQLSNTVEVIYSAFLLKKIELPLGPVTLNRISPSCSIRSHVQYSINSLTSEYVGI